MSAGVRQSLFFLRLPDLKKLVGITLTLQEEDEEPRSKQMKTCRELVLLFSDILASPALDSFADISVVMSILFFQKGVLQAFGQRRRLQLGSPRCVFPGDLQRCLSYSLITRLAPSWNKAGLYLVSGKDFLSEGGRLNAVSMELSTSEGQLCISIEASAVRLPPATLEDFGLPPLVLRRFCSDPDSILNPTSTRGTVWCHVLPSMKKGQIITISRHLPRDGPFRTYRDLQNHWSRLYGYRLPELAEEEVVYCSVYFRLVGERLFTYPLSCIRLQPVQLCPQVDLQGALCSFLSDIRDRAQSVCGFPALLTSKPCYHTGGLNTAASVQVSSGERVNLTTSSSPRSVLTQLHAPPPPRPMSPSFASQPPAWTPLSQHDGAQGLLGNGCGFGNRPTQSQECRGDWPSSSQLVPLSFCESSGSQSAPSLPLFQPASSLTSSSSVLPPFPPPSQTSINPAPKLVPIFKNKHPSCHVSVALLRVQKQKEQLSRGGEGNRRMTLPPFGKSRPATAPPSPSPSFASLPIPPPPTIPRFSHRTIPQPSAHPKIKHISSLSPASQAKPRLILTPKPEMKLKSRFSPKTRVKASSERSSVASSNCKMEERATKPPSAQPEPPQPLTSSMSNKQQHTSNSSRRFQRTVFESKPKKEAVIQDVDVEKMARSNQLSKLNSVTLLAWLKRRGVLISAKHKKEELMLKVMGCLAEA